MENRILLAGHTIEVKRPTLKIMHLLKESLGADILTGLSEEQNKKLSVDFRKMANVCSTICSVYKGDDTQPKIQLEYQQASDFFFENLEVSEFRRIMSFFSNASNQSSADSEAKPMNSNAQKSITQYQVPDSTMLK